MITLVKACELALKHCGVAVYLDSAKYLRKGWKDKVSSSSFKRGWVFNLGYDNPEAKVQPRSGPHPIFVCADSGKCVVFVLKVDKNLEIITKAEPVELPTIFVKGVSKGRKEFALKLLAQYQKLRKGTQSNFLELQCKVFGKQCKDIDLDKEYRQVGIDPQCADTIKIYDDFIDVIEKSGLKIKFKYYKGAVVGGQETLLFVRK